LTVKEWNASRIDPVERDRYLTDGNDFIADAVIHDALRRRPAPDAQRLRALLDKSLAIENLTIDECADLMAVDNPEHRALMEQTALAVKKKVYDNRIVTFAPLYMSSKCVNNCSYCGFRSGNCDNERRVLSQEEISRECAVLAGTIGHKRLIVVYGEHPESDAPYIAESIQTIYSVDEPTRRGRGRIRRVNVNAAPLSIENLKVIKSAGLGTYQVFQETYNRSLYARVHPAGTIKSDFRWRLYCMHRAMEAGIDDVGIGALFGLGDWQYEVLGLLSHARELEDRYGIGPHTISFPRLVDAQNAPDARSLVTDADLRRIVTILRLAIPHAGMILTCREDASMRRELLPLGITQTDADSKIGLGAYARYQERQEEYRQQFILSDTRSLDEVVRDLANMGFITSFCTAGYRCGRTGKKIMDLLRNGTERVFCKLNAVITFREWLDDFASEKTVAVGEFLIRKEIEEVRSVVSDAMFKEFIESYRKTGEGARDLYF
jgi:2-iminoacetate synthase